MKVRIVADCFLGDVFLIAGQDAIVSDTDGAFLIDTGNAILLSEDDKGGFAVPMPDNANPSS
jgi:hypothetical protein